MKKALTIGLAAAALAATLPLVTAGSLHQPETIAAADAFPPYQVLDTVRSMGLDPIRQPVRRGPYYVLHAYDPRGVEVRVVADAQFGDIVSVEPARALENAYAPNYVRGPRIIQVPQPGDRASVDRRDEPDADYHDDDDDAAPPPPARRVAPKPVPRSSAAPKPQKRSDLPAEPRRKPFNASPPPPPVERRTVLSAPPPSAQGPSPIYPTPRFGAKPDPVEKSEPPRGDTMAEPVAPLEGLAPPATLPRRN